LGLNYLYQDNDTKALENMYEAIAIDSNSADVWVNIGIIYDRLNDVDSAEFAYKRALSINNMHALANNNYAYSLASAGKELRKALEMVQTALQSEPNNSAYLDTYGWVLFKLGKKELAIEQILKSIEIGGAGPEVYEHLGDIYKEIGKMDDAIRAYKDGLSNYPNNDLLKTKLEEISK
jgi:Tfp pilus assembly protein PilF